MDVSAIIAGIDAEIAKLTEARNILQSVSTAAAVGKPGRGRPKGSKNAATAATPKTVNKPVKAKRKLSPEGRKRIAEAMKQRWAARRQSAAKA